MRVEHSDTTLRVRSMTKATDRRRGRGGVIVKQHTDALNGMVNGFLKATRGNPSAEDAEANFRQYHHQWQQHCRNMNINHPWLNADPEQFTRSVQLISQKAQKRLQPGRYYWNNYGLKITAAVVLGIIIYAITEYVLPHYGYTLTF